MAHEAFGGKTLMITGGTGSFGNTVLKHFLESDVGEIRIFSRDEKKQDDMRHALQARSPEHARKVRFLIGGRARRPERARRHARRRLRLPRGGAQAGALLRVLPHGGGPHQRDRHRQRAPRRDRRGRGQGRVPLHRQGGLPHQRHGQVEGHDGVGHLRQRPQRRRQDHHLLHALRQRHVLARQRDPALHRPNPRRAPRDGHRPPP